jgi:predicted phosphoribosyltransferase
MLGDVGAHEVRTMTRPFRDRREAGRLLGERLAPLAHRPDVIVLALPRGGVPVAYEVARALDAPLDVLLVRKLGLPGHEEVAMGAIASRGAAGVVRVLNPDVVARVPGAAEAVEAVTTAEHRELVRRERAYRHDRPPPDVRGRIVVLVDDGLATGSTMFAGVAALRELAPLKIIVAVPVGSAQACAALRQVADAVVCVVETPSLDGVGRWYADFAQTTDAEVRALLADAARPDSTPAPASA